MKGRVSLIILSLIILVVILGSGRIIFNGDNQPAKMVVGAIFLLMTLLLLILLFSLTNENDWLRKENAGLRRQLKENQPQSGP